jgi:hypothetical protein
MKKEDLIKLGLDEATAQKVADASATELQGFIPKARFDEVNTLKNTFEQQTKEHLAKIDELSKSQGNSTELQQKIAQMQTEYTAKEVKYQQDLKDLSLNSALKLTLNGKVHDTDIVAKLLDSKTIELDANGNITKGLEEQLKTLKETKAFLFKQEEQPKPGFKIGGSGSDPKPGQITSMNDAVLAAISQQK